MDNVLRRDVEVPQGSGVDETQDLICQSRLEDAPDLPQPRFVSGGLREVPIVEERWRGWAAWASGCDRSNLDAMTRGVLDAGTRDRLARRTVVAGRMSRPVDWMRMFVGPLPSRCHGGVPEKLG